MIPRVTSEFWVKAYVRRCNQSGVPAFVVQHGDDTAGTVLIKLNRLGNGCTIFQRSFGLEGDMVWLRATGPEPVEEPSADSYIQKQKKFDPDIWVIELEDPEGRHMLMEPVVD
ncbi:MAG: DUF1491 family protein [Alphaproteobacteria bacterium]|nr:DUF1491 family protein [Alphaproteobacteria bacterium]